MNRDRLHFLFLNIGHFLDHLFTLVFATVAALALTGEWGLSYDQLIPYGIAGFVAFGVFSLPAGRLADSWSREGMIAVFFIGIGLSSIATSYAQTPMQLGIGLFVVGIFAAIYHPVGLAIVVSRYAKTGIAIGINGVWGNLGVGSAALITGYFIDHGGWRSAFVWPGVVSILIGIAYTIVLWPEITAPKKPVVAAERGPPMSRDVKALFIRLTAIMFFTTAVSGIIFQSTTFALPKVFAERLGGIAGSATSLGWLTFMVFAGAAVAQLIVGTLLDRIGPRRVFMAVAIIQIVFFAAMPGLHDWAALLVALAFMLGAFGQIPINDYMIGRFAKSELRASVYGARYVVSFLSLGGALMLIPWVYRNWGFDRLFEILAVAAAVILCAVTLLPERIPSADDMVPAKA